MTIIKKNQVLIFIFFLALTLRILNPTYSLPTLYVMGDEAPGYMGALYVLAKQNWLVRTAIYPPFGSYLQIPFLSLTFLLSLLFQKVHSLYELKLLLLTQPGYFLFVPRLISGILGSLTVLVIYKICNLLLPKSKSVPLIASFLLAVAFNHGQVSHFGRPWAPAMFFFSLSLFFTLKSVLTKSKERMHVLLAAFFAVVSYGFHQIGVFALWFYLLARVIDKRESVTGLFRNKNTRLGLLLVTIGFIVVYLMQMGNPSADWYPTSKSFPSDYPLVLKLAELISSSSFVYNLKQLLLLEPVIFLGFLLCIKNQTVWKTPLKSIFIFTLTTFLAIGMAFKQPRYLLPALIPMCIFAALAIIQALKFFKNQFTKQVGFTLILIFASINLSFWNYLYIQKSSLTLAMEWIDQNIPPQSILLSAAGKFVPYTPAKEVLNIQQQKHPGFFAEAGKYLKTGEYPPNVRNIIYLDQLTDLNDRKQLPQFLNNFSPPASYLIDIYFDPKDKHFGFLNQNQYQKLVSFSSLRDKSIQIKIDNLLATVNEPVLPVLLLKSERTGPYIDIYSFTPEK
ncbi:MAG: hypothetical protein UV61_C0002G0193 [Candidatus Gottesmanbacteria bacterium GW2011_GWB1_43_11]|uniref:Glycosyltransferase RgtA/B/C/D-like domain-containing protein n=1 Tax=Candidatus Gottesmanbacteria bacterium GW2011_GWB1_43_11 TaxID=1618446 RepID=A0A0G1CPR6_9BACT|nr:MAG: hypothetical protein UV04_C0001G0081 [Candidatus Gottesmanbacteria bacterium GW2011_GWA2_42_16]KKS56270.1 MAG: hypothetical protein UV17_C0001G0080 [Candidatus Gottesmanbacteria bacterium GW2011_GWA1_42_26]KKS82603.1 MAG: hypothetical protein UV55_C0001G0063 [Candidatus Gottesmanbacteria bacterium GW2011_GWC1_43_10]KKS87472.1 MAG: hypothetical protein UV61_C0002G0193 [Candidatus Gottesmanbacteria bacterium GW2011_GWB1_43_11]OGG10153.1 MAG: hypothetical protein A2699_01240 [Candidatus Go